MLMRKADTKESYLIKELYDLIDLVIKWSKQLTVEHLYPYKNEEGKSVVPQVRGLRDIETAASLTSVAFNTLIKVQGEKELLKNISQLNNSLVMALYWYYKASEETSRDIFQTIKFLDLSKKLYPDEPLFDYKKYLWIQRAAIYFPDLEPVQKEILKQESIKALASAKSLSPDWDILKDLK
jgi:hypothetical protein